MATVGSAVGLGNIWRFPTVVGRTGGALFVLIYLIVVLLVGVTAMIAEFTLGRHTRQSPLSAFRTLKPNSSWWAAGALSVAAVVLILSFYSVIAGWSVAYVIRYWTGALSGLDAAGLRAAYEGLTAEPRWTLVLHFLFMSLTALVVSRGITGGIERWTRVLMPSVVVLLLFLLFRVLQLPGSGEGLRWLIAPDFALLNFATVLEATGQVFFSFSLGMGIMITYGSYLFGDDNIPQSAIFIAGADVAIALLAGLTVIPAVFAMGIEPEMGPGLIFVAVPAVFNTLPGGSFFGGAFFLMISFAALTTTLSLLEVGVSVIMDEWGWTRQRATYGAASIIFLLGVPSALSEGAVPLMVLGMTFLDAVDFFASNILLPLGGILTAIFVGWIWERRSVMNELERAGHRFLLAPLWFASLKYVVPLAIIMAIAGRFILG